MRSVPRRLTIERDPASRAFLAREAREWEMSPQEVVEHLIAAEAADEIVAQTTLRQRAHERRAGAS
jgi:hypothetical protein